MTPNEIKTIVRDILREDLGSYLTSDNQITLSKTVKLLGNSKFIGNFYFGRVVSDTLTTPYPLGWTISKSATGVYVITHNLNNSNFVVLTSIVDSNGGITNPFSKTSTTFTVKTGFISAGSYTAQDSNFDFILML